LKKPPAEEKDTKKKWSEKGNIIYEHKEIAFPRGHFLKKGSRSRGVGQK
jgi:hypothetical protein